MASWDANNQSRHSWCQLFTPSIPSCWELPHGQPTPPLDEHFDDWKDDRPGKVREVREIWMKLLPSSNMKVTKAPVVFFPILTNQGKDKTPWSFMGIFFFEKLLSALRIGECRIWPHETTCILNFVAIQQRSQRRETWNMEKTSWKKRQNTVTLV